MKSRAGFAGRSFAANKTSFIWQQNQTKTFQMEDPHLRLYDPHFGLYEWHGHWWQIKLNTSGEIPYLRAPMYYFSIYYFVVFAEQSRNPFLFTDADDENNYSMPDVNSSSLPRLRGKSSRKKCDVAMCHIGMLAAAAVGIDLKVIAIPRDEAWLEEQGGRKKRTVSFTKHKAEPVLTGYRAGGMSKSNSLSIDETTSRNGSYFHLSPLSEKHRTQSLGRKPWSKSASQPDVDGVYYKRIDSDSVFNDNESTRSTSPLLNNMMTSPESLRSRRNAPKSTKTPLKSKSSDSLTRNSQSPDIRKRLAAEPQVKDQRYSLPDIESQLPVNKLPPPPQASKRDLSQSPKTGLLLDLDGGNARPRRRPHKNSSSTDESMTPTGSTPEAEYSRGFDNFGRDETRSQTWNNRTGSSTTTDLWPRQG